MTIETVQFLFFLFGTIFFVVMICLSIAGIIAILILRRRVTLISQGVKQQLSNIRNIYDHKEAYIFKLISKGASGFVENIAHLLVKHKK